MTRIAFPVVLVLLAALFTFGKEPPVSPKEPKEGVLPVGADGKPLKKFTTVFLETGERGALEASETTELLHYGLPDLSDMEVSHAGAAVQAAE